MKREEAIAILQDKHDECKAFYDLAAHPEDAYPGAKEYMEALQIAIAALRGPTREQVEKVWRSEWTEPAGGYADGELVYDIWECSECGYMIDEEDDPDMLQQFCPECYAAMTDKAVDIVMERLETLKDETAAN